MVTSSQELLFFSKTTKTSSFVWLLILLSVTTQQQTLLPVVGAWMPYNSGGGSSYWDRNASLLWSGTIRKRRKNLPLSIGRAGAQQQQEEDDWNRRRRGRQQQQQPFSSEVEEEEESSTSLFFVPPIHDDVLQTLRFATSSVTTASTTYSSWDLEEIDNDGDDEQCEIPEQYKQQWATGNGRTDDIRSDTDIMEFLGIQRAKPLLVLQCVSPNNILMEMDWQ